MSNAAQDSVWLRFHRRQSNPALRLVCFPHAGGTPSFYRSWVRHLPDRIELVGVLYPGREHRIREPCATDLPNLAQAVRDSLAELADKPLVLFGHSLGALIAYEVARRLEKSRGPHPALLVVSGRGAPLAQSSTRKHLADDDTLWAEIKEFGGTSAELTGDALIRAVVLPTLRADYRLGETYRPEGGAPLHCPILACRGKADDEVTLAEAEAWSQLTEGPFEIVSFDGGHFYFVNDEKQIVLDIVRCVGRFVPMPEETDLAAAVRRSGPR